MGVDTVGNGIKGEKGRESADITMEIYMRENGREIRRKERECIYIDQGICTRGNGGKT